MKKIGFLGPIGTFSHEAVRHYVEPNEKLYKCEPFNSIQEIVFALQEGKLDEAIVPIENSLEGAINITLDLLTFDVDLKIKNEVVRPIVHNLLVKKGTKKEDITFILSHPQPLGQCRKYLVDNFTGVNIVSLLSTAEAAQEVINSDGSKASIGSRAAAEIYGLDILYSEIQDGYCNCTRFLVLAKKYGVRSGNDKTSIVFSTDNKPGCLYRILDIFNLFDINMSHIESRPAKEELGKYVFFLELNGHIEDENVKDALTLIKRKTSFYKYLGSYPEYRA